MKVRLTLTHLEAQALAECANQMIDEAGAWYHEMGEHPRKTNAYYRAMKKLRAGVREVELQANK